MHDAARISARIVVHRIAMGDASDSERASLESFTPMLEPPELAPELAWEDRQARWRRKSFAIAVLLFLLTVISTLAVGAQFAASYAAGRSPDVNDLFSSYATLFAHPQFLL